jgi:hypothetical protein
MSTALLLLAVPLYAGETQLGKPISVQSPTAIKELLQHPESYLGKDVRIEGEITEVCQMMGCWMNVKDASSSESIQVKVNDGEIVFPKDSPGKRVVAEGKFEKLELSKDQYIAMLKHQAEETGRHIETSNITQGQTIYRLKGAGALIKD